VLKLLLIAPNCDGRDVGEAWVGYQWARGLAHRHDVTLLYHKSDKILAAHQSTGLRVIEWAQPAVLASMLKPGYVLFYLKARRWIRAELTRGERFDLAYSQSR
jgi:hypothetical protein